MLKYTKKICFLILLACIIFVLTGSAGKNGNNVADGFTIEKYNVILDVKEDNKVNVTEQITVNWYDKNHHGIYKFTPEWLEYTGQNGKTIKRKSIINYMKSESDPYSIDWVNKKMRIKIGSPYEYVDYGLKTYVITYQYDMGKDPFKGFDEFIFHAYGDYWGTPIENPTIEIRMPKDISDAGIKFFTDKYRQNEITSNVDYEIRKNIIYAKYNSNSKLNSLNSSLTIDIELPENYFVGGSWNYGYKSILLCVVILVLMIVIIIMWFKFGKNFPKKAETIEFYPPNNLNAAEIGYIYNKCPGKKLTIALIIQLASKGYIKIDETEDDIKITNLCIEPKKYINIEKILPTKTIVVKKIKDADVNLDKKTTIMMKFLFNNGNEKTLQTNIEKFEVVEDTLVNLGYVEIISDNRQEIEDKRLSLKKKYNKQEQEYIIEKKLYDEKMSKLKPLSMYEEKVYKILFVDKNEIYIKEHPTLYTIFDSIDMLLDNILKDLINDKKANDTMKKSYIITSVQLLLSVVNYYYFQDLAPSMSFLYYISFISVFISLFFTLFMKRKTNYGEEMIAKINGFRNFLITVEKEKLEAMVKEHPTYFYDILPYTYVLNISKIWISKFENIPMPNMNIGNFNFSNDSLYSSIYDNVQYPVHTPSASSGGGGYSSCGGGCSSCGGGCSSCGGGGSW